MISDKKQNTKKGITLVETLLYLGLFAMIFLVIIRFYLFVSVNDRLAKHTNRLSRAGIFVNEHIDDSFGESTALNVGESIFDSPNGVLALTGDATAYQYSIQNNDLVFTSGGISTRITGDLVEVDSFYLEKLVDEDALPIGVKMTLVVSTSVEDSMSRTYQTSYILGL